jgi:hypothetical protein
MLIDGGWMSNPTAGFVLSEPAGILSCRISKLVKVVRKGFLTTPESKPGGWMQLIQPPVGVW